VLFNNTKKYYYRNVTKNGIKRKTILGPHYSYSVT
jgi:hypothetical protein